MIPQQKRAVASAAAGRPDVRVAAQLEREQVEPRVEADDELAVPLDDGLGEAVGEGRRGDGGGSPSAL